MSSLTEVIFKKIIEASPVAIVLIDRQGVILLINHQTEKLFGYTNEELLNQKVEILLPDRYRGKHQDYRND